MATARLGGWSGLVLREELHECRVRDAQDELFAAPVRPSRFACPTEIEYTYATFKQAYDLLRTDLQLLRDFGRGKVFCQRGEACR